MIRFAALLLIVPLAACAGFPALPYTSPTYFAYRCESGSFEVRLGDEAALVLWDARRLALPQVPSASGTKFQDEMGNLLWLKGDAAMFQTESVDWRECVGALVDTPWRAAAVRGVDFRAVGNEPGWRAEIDRDRGGLILLDYGATVLRIAASETQSFPMPMKTDGPTASFTIEDTGCRDPMSGEYSPLTVTLTVDGRLFHGCGRQFD